eukprot:6178371-Pleurochrysis_carterae.AAC.1
MWQGILLSVPLSAGDARCRRDEARVLADGRLERGPGGDGAKRCARTRTRLSAVRCRRRAPAARGGTASRRRGPHVRDVLARRGAASFGTERVVHHAHALTHGVVLFSQNAPLRVGLTCPDAQSCNLLLFCCCIRTEAACVSSRFRLLSAETFLARLPFRRTTRNAFYAQRVDASFCSLSIIRVCAFPLRCFARHKSHPTLRSGAWAGAPGSLEKVACSLHQSKAILLDVVCQSLPASNPLAVCIPNEW